MRTEIYLIAAVFLIAVGTACSVGVSDGFVSDPGAGGHGGGASDSGETEDSIPDSLPRPA